MKRTTGEESIKVKGCERCERKHIKELKEFPCGGRKERKTDWMRLSCQLAQIIEGLIRHAVVAVAKRF